MVWHMTTSYVYSSLPIEKKKVIRETIILTEREPYETKKEIQIDYKHLCYVVVVGKEGKKIFFKRMNDEEVKKLGMR